MEPSTHTSHNYHTYTRILHLIYEYYTVSGNVTLGCNLHSSEAKRKEIEEGRKGKKWRKKGENKEILCRNIIILKMFIYSFIYNTEIEEYTKGVEHKIVIHNLYTQYIQKVVISLN